jgi:hypothetical protein
MLGDYYKQNPQIAEIVDSAIQIIKWFNHHSFALGLFNAEQLATNKDLNEALALILPVISRWTSHFCALTRLLAVNKPMKLAVTRSAEEMIDSVGSRAKDKEIARKVLERVGDNEFWKELTKSACPPCRNLASLTCMTQDQNPHRAACHRSQRHTGAEHAL